MSLRTFLPPLTFGNTGNLGLAAGAVRLRQHRLRLRRGGVRGDGDPVLHGGRLGGVGQRLPLAGAEGADVRRLGPGGRVPDGGLGAARLGDEHAGPGGADRHSADADHAGGRDLAPASGRGGARGVVVAVQDGAVRRRGAGRRAVVRAAAGGAGGAGAAGVDPGGGDELHAGREIRRQFRRGGGAGGGVHPHVGGGDPRYPGVFHLRL